MFSFFSILLRVLDWVFSLVLELFLLCGLELGMDFVLVCEDNVVYIVVFVVWIVIWGCIFIIIFIVVVGIEF